MLVTRQGFLCNMEVYISSAVGRQERPEHEIKDEPQSGVGCAAVAFMNGSGTELIGTGYGKNVE